MTAHQLSTRALPRSTPEAQGVSSSAIAAFLSGIEEQQIELHSMMLVRYGRVIAEGWWSPYSADRIHLLYSLSKSFTSTAIGMAVEEGRLSVDDTVLSFFPEEAPQKVSPHLETMRVHHLLSMATGHRQDALGPMIEQATAQWDGDWIAAFFSVPPDQEPGTIFAYNNAATFMLSAILQKLTGMKLVDYLQPRLFTPLGITQTYWLETPQGINAGFSGLHITTDAIARLGQLYLQKGQWQGQQLIPAQWVEKATSKQITTSLDPEDPKMDWAQGYGYQFWQCRHGAYRGDGAFGQFCVVMPEQDAVLATTAGVDNMQSVLYLVWEHLLPAMNDSPLTGHGDEQQALSDRLTHLAIQPVTGNDSSPMAASISGKTYIFPATGADARDTAEQIDDEGEDTLKSVTLDFHDDHVLLVAKVEGAEHQVRAGYNRWTSGATALYASQYVRGDVPVVSSGAWTAPDVFTMQMRYIQTPHALTLEFHVDEARVRVRRRWNVNFGPVEMPEIEGRVA